MALSTIGPAQPHPPGRRSAGADDDPALRAAERLVDALAARSYRRIYDVLAPDVHFRYLVPRGPAELDGAADTAAKFHAWFGDADATEREAVEANRVADRTSLRYRLRVRKPDGWAVIEQQLYLDVDAEGRLARIDLLCSGFRPVGDRVADPAPRIHAFDAGSLGCADGLAEEFRRRINAIPVGDVLAVTAGDPAAKEDLPPLARMLGHTVLSAEPTGDGRITFTVERGR